MTEQSTFELQSPLDNGAGGDCGATICYALSCPFCGGKAQAKAMTPRKYDTMAFMTVECQSCGACGPVSAGVDSQKAIRKWNDQIGWQCQHSARYLLEDKTPESVAEFTGLPLGVVVSAFENIMQNV